MGEREEGALTMGRRAFEGERYSPGAMEWARRLRFAGASAAAEVTAIDLRRSAMVVVVSVDVTVSNGVVGWSRVAVGVEVGE